MTTRRIAFALAAVVAVYMALLGWRGVLWEHMVAEMDHRIKGTGTENASFPLLIPQSYLSREAEHVRRAVDAELKGYPVRVEIRPRDLKNNQATIAARLG